MSSLCGVSHLVACCSPTREFRSQPPRSTARSTQSLWHHCPHKNRNCSNLMKASRNSSPTFCRVEITSSRRRRISCRKSGKCLPRYRRFPAHAFLGSLAADRPASLCLRPRTKLSKPLQSLAHNVLPGGLLPLRSADYTHMSCPRKRVSSNHWRSLSL